MKLVLIAPGRKMPAWVDHGFQEYARRMPRHLSLQLVEINSARKTSEQVNQAIEQAIPGGSHRVALCVDQVGWSTEKLARRMGAWQALGQDLALLVGPADGLSDKLQESARERWSLGALTLPHTLVRIVIAEQLYRAHSMLSNHPYHRA